MDKVIRRKQIKDGLNSQTVRLDTGLVKKLMNLICLKFGNLLTIFPLPNVNKMMKRKKIQPQWLKF